jgi:hypothetical protein
MHRGHGGDEHAGHRHDGGRGDVDTQEGRWRND